MTDAGAVVVRGLEPRDLPEWIELRARLWPDDTSVHQEVKRYFDDGTIAGIPHGVFVAVCTASDPLASAPAQLVGFAECSLHAGDDPRAHLEGWYVQPEWRRRGVGRRLVAAVAAWSHGHGCASLTSDTTAEYAALSVPAHLGCGFKEERARRSATATEEIADSGDGVPRHVFVRSVRP